MMTSSFVWQLRFRILDHRADFSRDAREYAARQTLYRFTMAKDHAEPGRAVWLKDALSVRRLKPPDHSERVF